MYLKSLTVRGFKSFASTTVFEFEPGLNVLVGPNGSGKSNVVDALAWAMGAQGAKALRGAAMKDVIFAGGSGRSSLGRAQVELVIDNSDRALPLALDEVRISRTMFSAGGSEYAINGESARLADVQDLLADSGLGRELHTLVGQGQVDRILHGTAADRRELLEQAAGLLKHRRRQAKTAGKLDDLKANLDRLEDLAAELEGQLEGRREQAETARQASAVAARVRSLVADLLVFDAQQVQETVQELSGAAGAARLARQQAEATDHRVSGELAQVMSAQGEVEQRFESLVAEMEQMQVLGQRVRSLALVAQERLRQVGLGVEVEDAAIRLERARQVEEQEQRAVEDAATRLEQAQQVLAERHQVADRVQAAHREAREALENFDSAVEKRRERTVELTAELAAARVELERAEGELERRRGEQVKHQDAAEHADTALAACEGEVKALEVKLEESAQEEESARADRLRKSEAQQKSLELVHELELEVNSLQARCTALESAWVHDRQGSAESEADLQEAQADGAREIISLLDIEPSWEAACAALIGPYATALMRPDGQAIPGAVSSLHLPVGEAQAELEQESQSLAQAYSQLTGDTASPWHQHVKLPTWLEKPLHLLVGEAYFVATEADAHTLLAAKPRARAITPTGLILTAHSRLEPAGDAELFNLYHQLEESKHQLEQAQEQLHQATAEHQAAEQALASARIAEQQAAHRGGEIQAQLTTARTRAAHEAGRQEKQAAETTRLREATSRAQTSLQEAQEKLASATEALHTHTEQAPNGTRGELKNQLDQLTHQLTEASTALTRATAEADYAQESSQTAQARLTQAKAAHQASCKAHQKAQASQDLAQRNQLTARQTLAKTQALTQAMGELSLKQATERTSLHNSLEHHKRTLAELREEQASAQRALTAALTLHAESAAHRARHEARWEVLEQQAEQELGHALTDLIKDHPQPETTREEVTTALNAARQELAALGLTNPLALEEYEALTQRHSYLRQQIQDIKKSRADVRAVMKEVTEHIDSSFTSALTDVQEEFSRIFATLFPGGEGKLVLADPNNPQTSGLDIQVKPVGKKITRLSLLSGGERTLASLALLLAVFIARPAPFYVLDEVEAALDDRNLGRLLQVLDQLRGKSQLMMITHHQRTMAQADTLYGISMRQGISRVLSHRMSQEETES